MKGRGRTLDQIILQKSWFPSRLSPQPAGYNFTACEEPEAHVGPVLQERRPSEADASLWNQDIAKAQLEAGREKWEAAEEHTEAHPLRGPHAATLMKVIIAAQKLSSLKCLYRKKKDKLQESPWCDSGTEKHRLRSSSCLWWIQDGKNQQCQLRLPAAVKTLLVSCSPFITITIWCLLTIDYQLSHWQRGRTGCFPACYVPGLIPTFPPVCRWISSVWKLAVSRQQGHRHPRIRQYNTSSKKM